MPLCWLWVWLSHGWKCLWDVGSCKSLLFKAFCTSNGRARQRLSKVHKIFNFPVIPVCNSELRSHSQATVPGHNPNEWPCPTVSFAFTQKISTVSASVLVLLMEGSVSSAMWDKNVIFKLVKLYRPGLGTSGNFSYTYAIKLNRAHSWKSGLDWVIARLLPDTASTPLPGKA